MRLSILTTGRQDYGLLRSTLLLLKADLRFEPLIWVGGMHLAARYGRTIDLIRSDELEIDAELGLLTASDNETTASCQIMSDVSALLGSRRPDALMLLGDRPETAAAGFAATLARVPIVHVHGGEETEGAIDNALRHALSKLSHLHLVSHEKHGARLRQMGELPSTIHVVGAPGLDNLFRTDLPLREELERTLGHSLTPPIVLATLHSTTLATETDPCAEVRALASAMSQVDATYVITGPNNDSGGDEIRQYWLGWVADHPNAVFTQALGERNFWGMLRIADLVVGNSSSGIIEAPAVGLPVINIGDRQQGRLRPAHVCDVSASPPEIAKALQHALQPATRVSVRRFPPLYLQGPAAPRIVEALAGWAIPNPPRKAFVDLPVGEAS